MMTRRTFSGCACGSFIAGDLPSASAGVAGAVEGGCDQPDTIASGVLWQLAAEPAATNAGIILTSGDHRTDAAFGMLIADLSGRFGVRPGFAFYDDSLSPNAFATPKTVFPGTRGTVLGGKTVLLDSLANPDRGDLFVMSVCAHEVGHILQDTTAFKARLQKGQATSKLVELHADFLAGFYLSVHGGDYRPGQMIGLGRAWKTLGDSNYTNAQHHGTAEERIAAIEQGFKIGRQRPNFDAMDMCEVGARYLGSWG